MNRRPPTRDPRDYRDGDGPQGGRDPRERVRARPSDRRSRNRRKPNVWGAIRMVALLLLMGECLRVAFTSPRLQLEQVVVAGKTRYAAQELIKQGEIPVGRNLFGVNLARVHERLLRNPVLKEAEVARVFPDTLMVTVKEREPALLIKGGGQAVHADREGVVFQKAASTEQDLPVLEMESKTPPPPGERLSPSLNKAAWECVELARQERIPVRALRVDAGGYLWLNVDIPATSKGEQITSKSSSRQTEDGNVSPQAPSTLPVRLGLSDDLPEKFRDVRMTLAGAPDVAHAKYLDVMSAGNPAYRLAPRKDQTD